MRKSETILSNIGLRLRQLREKNGMTQSTLARKAGVNRVTLNRYESSLFCPSLKTVINIAEALNIKISELIGE